jgi:hypothetical protein
MTNGVGHADQPSAVAGLVDPRWLSMIEGVMPAKWGGRARRSTMKTFVGREKMGDSSTGCIALFSELPKLP